MLLVTVLSAMDTPTDPPATPPEPAMATTLDVIVAFSVADTVMLSAAVVLLRDAALVPWMKAAIVLLTVFVDSAPAPESARLIGETAAEIDTATETALTIAVEPAEMRIESAELSVEAWL